MWVDECKIRPEICDPDLLATFVAEFARLAWTVGEVRAGRTVLSALDDAIALFRDAGRSTTALYRAKALYFRTQRTESSERLNALMLALKSADEATNESAATLIDLSEYYTECSRYSAAIKAVQPILRSGDYSAKLQCGAAVSKGTALFTSFRSFRSADRLLKWACAFEDQIDDDEGKAWVARALHYRARIAELAGRLDLALEQYLSGKRLQETLAVDTVALGYNHLRIADLLSSCGLINSARDHLSEAYRLFLGGSNVGAGMLQAELSEATLCAAEGMVDEAEAITRRVLSRSREVGYWRGELLCLGYLLVLHLRYHRRGTWPTVLQVVRTFWRGELRKNSLFKFGREFPTMLRLVIRRMSPRRAASRRRHSFRTCPCDLHASPSGR
jgi:tetratricopeptide (TPR) repeat protein